MAAVSFNEAMGVGEPPSGPQSTPVPSGDQGVSFNDAMGVKPAAASKPGPRFVGKSPLLDKVHAGYDKAKAAVTKLTNEYPILRTEPDVNHWQGKLGQAYMNEVGAEIRSGLAGAKQQFKAALSKDTKDDLLSPLKGPVHAGLGLLNLGQAIISPAWAPIQLGAIEPMHKIIDSTGANAGDKEGLKAGWDMLVNLMTAKIPGFHEPEKPVDTKGMPTSGPEPFTGNKKKVVGTDKDPESSLEGKLKAHGVDTKVTQAEKDQIEANKQKDISAIEQKLRAHQIDTKFDELATADPKNAQRFAEQVATVHPELGEALTAKVEEAQNRTPDEQVIAGRDSARATAGHASAAIEEGPGGGHNSLIKNIVKNLNIAAKEYAKTFGDTYTDWHGTKYGYDSTLEQWYVDNNPKMSHAEVPKDVEFSDPHKEGAVRSKYYIYSKNEKRLYGPHSKAGANELTSKWNKNYKNDEHYVVKPDKEETLAPEDDPSKFRVDLEDEAGMEFDTQYFDTYKEAQEFAGKHHQVTKGGTKAKITHPINPKPGAFDEPDSLADLLTQKPWEPAPSPSRVSNFVKTASDKVVNAFIKAQSVLENPKFLKWFRDSQIVDDKHEPQVMYHSSPADIEIFRPGHQGNAIFVSPDPRFAETMGNKGENKQITYPVYIRAVNPWDYRVKGHGAALLRRLKQEAGGSDRELRNITGHDNYGDIAQAIRSGDWSMLERERVQAVIRKMGHDGFFVREGGHDNLGVYNPNQLKSAVGNSGEFSIDDDRIHMSKSDEPSTGLWHNVQNKLDDAITRLKSDRKPISGKTFIDMLIDKVPKEGLSSRSKYQLKLLKALRKAIGEVPIKFVSKLDWVNPESGSRESVHGMYYTDHSIEVVHNGKTVQTAIHELTHAATINFMNKYPDHPLSKEMNRLFAVAQKRLAQAKLEHKASWKQNLEIPYGMKDVHEFIAETLSNRNFQKWLMESERFAEPGEKIRNLWNQFATLVQKMLGLDDKQATLLHNVMEVGEKIVEERGKQMESTAPQIESKLLSAGLRESMRDVHAAAAQDDGFFGGLKESAQRNVAIGKLAEWNRNIIQTFNPTALGPKAEIAASTLAKRTAEAAQKDAAYGGKNSAKRHTFWERLGNAKSLAFTMAYEKGERFSDPKLQEMADGYKRWNEDIFAQDKRTGFTYEPIDHYMMHAFESGGKIPLDEFLQKKFGSKWKDPAFIKDRGFELYEEAIKEGYKPKFKTPEEIMQARQHASNVAEMQVSILEDLTKWGAAVRKEKGVDPPLGFGTQRRSPTGQEYYIHRDAAALLHNAFDTFSLWNAPGIAGSLFRGGMGLKNRLVPIRLASLFHVAHLSLALDNATGFAQGARLLLSGGSAAVRGSGLAKLLNSLIPLKSPFWDNPRAGSRVMRAYRGEIEPHNLTNADLQAFQYMAEGGFIPYMDRHWRSNAMQAFKSNMNKGQIFRGMFNLPFAAIQSIMHPMFEKWIPAMKTAAYLSEVTTQMKLTPELASDPLKRQNVLRRLAQHVDDRYGEMNYANMFWPKWIKDLFVLNTLSLGWQKGLISQFGGAPIDLLKMPFKGSLGKQLKGAELNKVLWTSGYITMAMGYTGALSYMLSGKPPEGTDYFMPRDGDGGRLNTPFFTREFYSIYRHAQSEGTLSTASDIVQGKGSGLVSLAAEAVTGTISIAGHEEEIRDPNAPAFKQIAQTLHSMLRDVEPISMQQTKDTTKSKVEAFTGFTKAPQYATDTPAIAKIKHLYREYHTPGKTSYSKAQYSSRAKEVREALKSGDPSAGDKLSQFQSDYGLSGQQLKNFNRSATRGESMEIYMFSKLDKDEQLEVLKDIPEAEQMDYLHHVSKRRRAELMSEISSH